MKFEICPEDQNVIDNENMSACSYPYNQTIEEYYHDFYSSKHKINSNIAQFLFNLGIRPDVSCFYNEILGIGYFRKFGWSGYHCGQYGYFFPLPITDENIAIYNYRWINKSEEMIWR
jgi:hypothetical protein